MSSQYLFGDTGLATQRLRVLAEVFADSSRAFLRDTATAKLRLALDLGCGPGYSTHLLADVLQCDRVAGLDNSEHFILLAQGTRTSRVSFQLHDVTAVPFPVGLSDLLYCRLLLTHLTDPRAVVGKWAMQLEPNGLLLIEEVERIHTRNRVFSTYLKILEAVMTHQSNRLYIGPVLDGLEDPPLLKRRVSQIRRFPVSTDKAATMFSLNLQTWKTQPFVRASYAPALIEQLEQDLAALIEKPGRETEIEWELRQIVFERA